MSFLSLIYIELKKIRRSKIIMIFFIATIILWVPSIFNVDANFHMQPEGISPENNFLIQGLLAVSWFMFPATMIVSTVLLNQGERSNNGILKMFSLPINTKKLCLAKFVVLLILAAVQICMVIGAYFISATIASKSANYDFMLSIGYVLKEGLYIYISAIPMIAFFWLISVFIKTPIFSMGIGLASIVPSVLMINTKAWFTYPMSYPFYIITAEYGKVAPNLTQNSVDFIMWIPVALIITILCLTFSCMSFGRYERR